MSVLLSRRKKLSEVPVDEVYVIYGEGSTGKTVIASTFPKSEEKKLLYIDIGEGGTGSIPTEYKDMIEVVTIQTFDELDEVITDLINGYSLDDDGTQVPVRYSTVVFDTVTQMEYMLKNLLKQSNNKDSMTLNLWGKTKETSEFMYYLLRVIHQKSGAVVVALAHVKAISKEAHPDYDILLPSLMESAARTLCAKASYVWYTDVKHVDKIDPDTSEVTKEVQFLTTIERVPYLATKCRKPPKFTGKIPVEMRNLTYDRFKKQVINLISEEE